MRVAIKLEVHIVGGQRPASWTVAARGVSASFGSELTSPDDAKAYTDMTFSLPTNQLDRARKAIEDARDAQKINYGDLVADTDVAKVSVVGIGMRSQVGVAAKMFASLAAENVNIKVITTSEIKISVLIDRKYMELAVQALHDTFELEKA